MPPLSPPRQSRVGGPSRRKRLSEGKSLGDLKRFVIPPLPHRSKATLGAPGGFDSAVGNRVLSILRPRDCLGIGSGLSRDWFGFVSGLSRDFLGNGSVKSETVFGQLLRYSYLTFYKERDRLFKIEYCLKNAYGSS